MIIYIWILAEEGLYLALDLGGTNFRVLLLELSHGAPVREEVKRYYIGSELRVGSAIPLFDYLAECVSDFVIAQGLQNIELPLGKLNSHIHDASGCRRPARETFN